MLTKQSMTKKPINSVSPDLHENLKISPLSCAVSGGGEEW